MLSFLEKINKYLYIQGDLELRSQSGHKHLCLKKIKKIYENKTKRQQTGTNVLKSKIHLSYFIKTTCWFAFPSHFWGYTTDFSKILSNIVTSAEYNHPWTGLAFKSNLYMEDLIVYLEILLLQLKAIMNIPEVMLKSCQSSWFMLFIFFL